MRKKGLDNNDEGGFILVTAIILLAILMGLGAAGMFKSRVQIKVSGSAADSAKAFAAAQAGLDYVYHGWSRGTVAQKKEFSDIVAATTSAGAAPTILINKAPTAIADLGATAALVDTWVQGSGARVYNLTNGGIAPAASAARWNVDKYAQVAVWVTRFQKPTVLKPYPYDTYSSAACANCTAVTYVLGRAGNAYKLLREYSSVSISTIQTYGAMMNAPKYNGDADCASGTPSTTVTTSTPPDPTTGGTLWKTSHLIDATQAPGGVAMASNNGINAFSSNKAWKTGYGTGTTLTANGRAIDMFVIYDPGKVVGTNYPEINGNSMSAIWATTVRDSLFVPPKKPMNYFTTGNQLFSLDAYREAANRISGFADEKIGNYWVRPVGLLGAANTPLTQEVVDLRANNGGQGRAGTLNWNELTYNISRSIPMYGLLRFMIPMVDSGSTTSVCKKPSTVVFNPLFDPIEALESPDGKLIVYGGALFDFYNDLNSDGVYDPATESLLTREEAQASSKINVNNPLMFNPVMDAMIPRTGQAGAANTCDVLAINCYPNGAPSWDIYTDAFTFNSVNGVGGTNNADGIMDLIWDVDHVARNWGTKVKATGGTYKFTGFSGWMKQESPAVITSTATSGSHQWLGSDKVRMKSLLNYYIRTTSAASKNVWYNSTGATTGTNLVDIESNSTNFYIDTGNDLVHPTASAADLYHTFLPSGYIHGWKRGIFMTGLANLGADQVHSIWNTDLIQDGAAGAVSPSSAMESKTFFITGVGATAKIDKNFADIPAEMYAGGLVDMHHAVNISGVVYTPDMLELEQKDKGTQGTTNGNAGGGGGAQAALQYINGIVISGGGVYMKDETNASNARTVISYDDTSIDNLRTNGATPGLGRKYWQELK